MMDTLTQPTVRLDLSRSITLLDPLVERRGRRWAAQPAAEAAADPIEPPPAERLSDALSSRTRAEPVRQDSGAELQPVWPEIPAARAPVAAVSLQNGQSGAESHRPELQEAAKGRQVAAKPAPRPCGQEPERQEPVEELPSRTSSDKSGPPREKGVKTPSLLRMAGFPEACVEQPEEAEGPQGRPTDAGFSRAAVGSDSSANRSLFLGRAGAAPREDALPDAAGALTTPVQILSKPCPRYPEEALLRRVQGDVLLDVEFRYSGTLEVLGVRRGLGQGLNESAIEAARKMRFVPARRDGRPVDTLATLRIRFQLLH